MKSSREYSLVVGLVALLNARAIAFAAAQIPDCTVEPACQSLYDKARQESKKATIEENKGESGRGQRLRHLEEALRLYRLAYEVTADPRLLFTIARVLQKLERHQEAEQYISKYDQSPLDVSEKREQIDSFRRTSTAQSASPTGERRETSALTESSIGSVVAKPETLVPIPPSSSVPTPSAMNDNSRASGNTLSDATRLEDKDAPRPIHKKPWFWAVVGVGIVAVVGIGVGLGIGLTRSGTSSSGPSILTGVNTYEPRF